MEELKQKLLKIIEEGNSLCWNGSNSISDAYELGKIKGEVKLAKEILKEINSQ